MENIKHAGWSESESNLLWETADEAQQQGLPLKQVFERIAERTGRRPNSIRNYYYAQVRQRGDGTRHTARFVPFTEPEVETLLEQILRGRARGQSVRACLTELSGGDHRLMLRYQNKYRSILRSRPELIESVAQRLRSEGISCPPVEVRTRPRVTLSGACEELTDSARRASDPELIRACEAFARLILSSPGTAHAAQMDRMNVRMDLYRLTLAEQADAMRAMCEAAGELACTVKEFLVRPAKERAAEVDAFSEKLTQQVGRLEAAASQAETPAQ